METLNQQNEKRGINKLILGIVAIGVLIAAGIVVFMLSQPTKKEAEQQKLEGAYREGSPEFAQLTKKIIAETDENRTMQSPTGIGTINMYIGGTIRNFCGKTLTGLELDVAVIDMKSKPIKQKTIIVIPTENREILANNEVMPVNVILEGFAKDDDRANVRWKVTAIKVE
jgi:hypothetical protein